MTNASATAIATKLNQYNRMIGIRPFYSAHEIRTMSVEKIQHKLEQADAKINRKQSTRNFFERLVQNA